MPWGGGHHRAIPNNDPEKAAGRGPNLWFWFGVRLSERTKNGVSCLFSPGTMERGTTRRRRRTPTITLVLSVEESSRFVREGGGAASCRRPSDRQTGRVACGSDSYDRFASTLHDPSSDAPPFGARATTPSPPFGPPRPCASSCAAGIYHRMTYTR